MNKRPHPVIVDQEAFRRLPGVIAIYRAGYALAQGDVVDTVKYARQAIVFIAEDDHIWRGAAAALLGLAYWTTGDLDAAHRSYTDGMAHLQRAGHITDAVGGAIALADIRITQGRLREAMSTYEQALQLATEHGTPILRGTADMYVGMSTLYRERNDLNAATQLLLRSKEQGEHTGFPQNPYRWRVAMARIREAEGDLDSALELLQEAEHLYVSDFYPNVRPVTALKTRVWVNQGRLVEALGWAREQGPSVENDLTYLHEFEHITLVRVLLARYKSIGKSDEATPSLLKAVGLLERLLQAAEKGERTGSVIEISVLQALAHQLQDDIPAALVPLQRALTLAEPEDYVRIFVDEGPAMAVLLQEAAKHRIAPHYVRQLLTAFDKAEDRPPADQVLIGTGVAGANARRVQSALTQQALTVEPLSERELEVLRLLATDLNGPEIARKLIVSLNTMHTHTKNIYSKFGVNNRRAAVHRAEELGLL
jgi:LuxR family maltose regulon positive regulatory protein